MCEEIELHRYDETPWGFRLTGGHDFGIPLTVVRVTGGSLAEEAGMCVGDMIIEINGDTTAQITHSEAQQYILEAGNHITLAILRGSPVPAVTPTRGLHTPSVIDRATSSVGSLIEYESIHSDLYRDNVVSVVSESNESGHEMTEEEIAEKLLENAEVIENNGKNVIGVNFKRFVPKCDFIKNSLVFQTLQEEQIFDKKSEQDQLKKCPTKRFSTFLTTPNRPKIKPPEKKKPAEIKEIEIKESTENKQVEEKDSIKSKSCEQVCTNCKCKLKDIEDFPKSTTETAVATDIVDFPESTVETAVATDIEQIALTEIQNKDDSEKLIDADRQEKFELNDNDQEKGKNDSIIEESIEKTEEINESENVEIKIKPENEFEKSILDIQNQISAIRELPLQIQNHILLLEKQLSDLLSHKIKSTVTTFETLETNKENFATENNEEESLTEPKITEDNLQESYDGDDDDNGDGNDDVFETVVDEINENIQEEESKETIEDNSDAEVEEREPSGRPIYPLTPLPRPIILPGGRKWRGPKDAYNEKFIAETLISQAEVLVGSTLGVNFRKYEPPKFDMSNSAVYKLVHNIETNTGGIENRPEIVAAEEDFYYHKPIDARQFYLATLPQPSVIPDFEKDNQYGH